MVVAAEDVALENARRRRWWRTTAEDGDGDTTRRVGESSVSTTTQRDLCLSPRASPVQRKRHTRNRRGVPARVHVWEFHFTPERPFTIDARHLCERAAERVHVLVQRPLMAKGAQFERRELAAAAATEGLLAERVEGGA